MSSSLPEDVQIAMYRSVPGLEQVELVRPAISLLFFHFTKINTSFINSCRCSCFKAIHFKKMLNCSKGPAVHSLRAQADKREYSQAMRQVLENAENLLIKQAEVVELLVQENMITGVKTFSGAIYSCHLDTFHLFHFLPVQ